MSKMEWPKNKKIQVVSRIVAICWILLCTLIIMYATPRNYIKQFPGGDSTYFMYIGKAMKEGRIMYEGAWDSKGPFLFLLNYIAMMINEAWGVWLIRTVFMLVFFFALYKLLMLISGNIRQSCIIMGVITLMLSASIGEGNLSEEYSLPLITISLYYFIQYIKMDYIELSKIILCGMLCGLTFMLRANMVITWIVFAAGIFIYMIWKKQGELLVKYILGFAIGFIISILPFALYFLTKGCLAEAWYASVVFNIKYCGTSSLSLFSMLMWLYHYLEKFNYIAILVVFGCIILGSLYSKKKASKFKFFGIVYVVYIIASVAFVCMSARQYNHYLMGLIPAIAVPGIVVLKEGEHWLNNLLDQKTIVAILSILSVIILNISGFDILKDNLKRYQMIPEQDNVYQQVGKYIQQNSGESDTIYAHRMCGAVYLSSDRLSATKYFALSAVNVDDFPQMSNQLFSDLKENNPIFIVTQDGRTSGVKTDERLNNYITENYKLEKEFDNGIHVFVRMEK